MTKQKQAYIIEAFTKDRHKLIESKQQDYAQSHDVLSNFRHVALAGGRKMSNVILDECHKKILRLQNLSQADKTPNNESIIDSVKDLANYTDLLVCAMTEEARSVEDIKAIVSTCSDALKLNELAKALGAALERVCFHKSTAYTKTYRIELSSEYTKWSTFTVFLNGVAGNKPLKLTKHYPTVDGESITYTIDQLGSIDTEQLLLEVRTKWKS